MEDNRTLMIEEPKTDNYNVWAMLCHLGYFSGLVIPFGSILAPLLIWLFKKSESGEVRHHGAESLNFQISQIIYFLGAIVIALLIMIKNPSVALIFGVAYFVITCIFQIVWVIIMSVKAYKRIPYTYPLTIRFIK